MNTFFTFFAIFCVLIISGCREEPLNPVSTFDCRLNFDDSSSLNVNNAKYLNLLSKIKYEGIPGITMGVFNEKDGMWLGAAGMADIYSGISFMPCNYTRFGSTVKTLTAVTILKLKEEGKLLLDDPVKKYLSDSILKGIENADKATVRQLLQHSAGLYNYIQDLKFQTGSLNDLSKIWQPTELLDYARNKDAYFEPGKDVRYSNTGYILLGMIIEKIENKTFYEVFSEKIFEPLQLTSTVFAATNPVPASLVRGYVDFYGNMNLINSTYYSGWDYYTADGGLISTPYDMARFMWALVDGKILNQSSMQEMFTFKSSKEQSSDYFTISYGLGIFKIETQFGDAWMHSGDAIGYFACMVYFPAYKTIIVWASNGNYGKLDALISSKKAMEEIFKTVLD